MYGEGKHTDHPEDAMKFVNETLANMQTPGRWRRYEADRFTAAYELLKRRTARPIQTRLRPSGTASAARSSGWYTWPVVWVDLDGVVSFHGNLAATEAPRSWAKKGAVKSKLLVLHGKPKTR